MAAEVPTADDLRAACSRLVASRAFGRAERSKRFLRYVVEQACTGQADRIKEYAIALEVFDRSAYDPKVDSVVRVEASKLRSLLEKYYDSEGADDPVVLELPKGAYVPRASFRRAAVESEPETAPQHESSAVESVASAASVAPALAAADVLNVAVRPPAERPSPGRRWRWVLAAAMLVAAIATTWAWRSRTHAGEATTGQPTLAVLPFVDLSPAAGHEHLADELTQEISVALAGLKAVQMPSRTSVQRYRAVSDDVRQIGSALGVHAVLEGAVRVQGDRVRVDVSLVDTRTGLRLWSDSQDRPMGDLRTVQREVSHLVARQVGLLADTRRALTRPHSAHPVAYQHYLRATYLLGGDAAGDLSSAIDLFRAATRADSSYALAWASLSSTLSLRADWGFVSAREVRGEAEAAAREALRLNAELPEAHQAAGRVHAVLQVDLDAAARAFQRGIELDPSSSTLRLDYARYVLLPLERGDEAEEQLLRARSVDPQNLSILHQLASAQMVRRDFDAATRTLAASEALSGRESPARLVYLGRLASLRGDDAEAVRQWEAASRIIRSRWVLSYLGWGLARTGRIDEARAVLEELRGGRFADADSAMAAVYCALGEHDTALAALARARGTGSAELRALRIDVRFAPLRDDARFRALLWPEGGRGVAGGARGEASVATGTR